MPLWELVSNIEELNIASKRFDSVNGASDNLLLSTDELTEDAITSFELPSAPFAAPFGGSPEEAVELHSRTIFRTVIAAARGGQLRSLLLPKESIQHPFAVRALLPCWVEVEDWAVNEPSTLPIKRWYEAANTLRPALYHAAKWMHEATAGVSDGLRLTREQVQSLHAYFTAMKAVPRFTSDLDSLDGSSPLFELYLPWLAEDDELAQRVADAWNGVVRRGEAANVGCFCERC